MSFAALFPETLALHAGQAPDLATGVRRAGLCHDELRIQEHGARGQLSAGL